MQLVYCLNCTICGKSYSERSTWLKHLCQDEHQNVWRRKRRSCWWHNDGGGFDKEMTQRTVTIFCSFSLSDPGRITSLLEKLSWIRKEADGGEHLGIIVTDLVWWPERDTVAYVQFESREVVELIFDHLEDPSSFQVGNNLVQLKRAVHLLPLEWKALLPKECCEPVLQNTSTNTVSAHALPIEIKTSYELSLQSQFNTICKSIEICEQDFAYILNIVNLIKEKFQHYHPSGEVVIYRNYHLRLKTSGTNSLLVFAYIAENPNDPHGYLPIDQSLEDSIFNCGNLQNGFPFGKFYRKPFSSSTEEGTLYQCGTSGFRLNFVTHPLTIVESQLSCLLHYLCTFDPHVKPLLILVHFWARSNGIQIAEKNIPHVDFYSNCPEPVALEWLVILFLSKEGLVPTVREILKRPHQTLVVTDNRHDIGFWEDPKFPKIWRKSKDLPPLDDLHEGTGPTDNFILEVVNLAQKFFHFYSSQLEEGCWVVNPKDGEILKREGLHLAKNKLTNHENKLFVRMRNNKAKPDLLISNFRILILHPLCIWWKLSFDVDRWMEFTCGKMKETAEKLKEFLKRGHKISGGGVGPTLLSILNHGGGQAGNPGGATSLADVYLNPPFPQSSIIKNRENNCLVSQYNCVCKAIEIPEEEFNYALELFSQVRNFFRKVYPAGQTVIFRNYYLRLRNTGTNTLLIYAFAGSPFDSTTFVTVPLNFQLVLPGFHRRIARGNINGTTYYEHEVSSFRFHFDTFPLVIVEAHLSLLVQYLCTFDPHVKPVLTLIYFWARSHNIKISEDEYPYSKYHSNCPEPVALEWLIISFLSGEQVVPKLREILERPHVPLLVSINKLDIGFSMDPEYPKEWRRSKGLADVEETVDVSSDQFILEVVSLVQRFFEFYSTNLEDGCWVVNPKDGEIIKREGTHIGKSGLSKEEIERLTFVQNKENTPGHLIISGFRIYVLHPLYITWKLSFDVGRWRNVTCGKMRMAGKRLKDWLNFMTGKKSKEQGTLEEVLVGGEEQTEDVRLVLNCETNENLGADIKTEVEKRKGGKNKRLCEDTCIEQTVKKTKGDF